MAALLAAAALGAAGTMGASYIGSKSAQKQQQVGINAAQEAEQRYRTDVERGITDSQGYYDEGMNALAGTRQRGDQNAQLLDDITGINGPEKQQNALAMYRSNPSAALLGNAREEAIRRTIGSSAAAGLSNSGSAATSLARRTSDMDLGDFYKWQENPRTMATMGGNANALAAQLAGRRGGEILSARSSLGAAGAGSSMMAGNAQMAGIGAQGQAWGTAAGQLGQTASNTFGKWWNQQPKAATGSNMQQGQLFPGGSWSGSNDLGGFYPA